ncbi:MAG: cell division protein ZapA [Bacteroidota bacterium]|jgi:cell division protein ZapA|nr:cell division protein ZapA [Bacteroidota bacterium]
MSELSIKIRIADRDYPMRVNEEEEERLRTAGRMINERLKAFREQFGIADKQDLLAMVALESLADKLHTVQSKAENESTLVDKLTHLNKLLASLKLE